MTILCLLITSGQRRLGLVYGITEGKQSRPNLFQGFVQGYEALICIRMNPITFYISKDDRGEYLVRPVAFSRVQFLLKKMRFLIKNSA
jgi:hypothetical protein